MTPAGHSERDGPTDSLRADDGARAAGPTGTLVMHAPSGKTKEPASARRPDVTTREAEAIGSEPHAPFSRECTMSSIPVHEERGVPLVANLALRRRLVF